MLRRHSIVKVTEEEKPPIHGSYELFKWDRKQVPTFEAYLKEVEPLSPRAKRATAIEHRERPNLIMTAGKVLLLSNLVAASVNYITECRLGTGTSTPLDGDSDVEGFLSPTMDVTRTTINGLTLQLDVFVDGTQCIGSVGNGVMCSGTPGTVFSHFLILPVVDHTDQDTLTLNYTAAVA